MASPASRVRRSTPLAWQCCSVAFCRVSAELAVAAVRNVDATFNISFVNPDIRPCSAPAPRSSIACRFSKRTIGAAVAYQGVVPAGRHGPGARPTRCAADKDPSRLDKHRANTLKYRFFHIHCTGCFMDPALIDRWRRQAQGHLPPQRGRRRPRGGHQHEARRVHWRQVAPEAVHAPHRVRWARLFQSPIMSDQVPAGTAARAGPGSACKEADRGASMCLTRGCDAGRWCGRR